MNFELKTGASVTLRVNASSPGGTEAKAPAANASLCIFSSKIASSDDIFLFMHVSRLRLIRKGEGSDQTHLLPPLGYGPGHDE